MRSRLKAACMAALLLAGCTEAAGQPTPAAGPATTAPATPSRTPTIAASPLASVRPSPRPGPTALELDFQAIDQRFTTPLLSAATTGTEVIWSSGAVDGSAVETAPDLYRFRPGIDLEPALIWQNPRREAVVEPIDGEGGRYAFAESGTVPGDYWRLWLLPAVDQQPVLLDDGNDGADVPSFIPSFDLAGDRIVWSAFHAATDGAESQLWQASAPDWTPELVRAVPASAREMWLPSLRGDRVAFVEVVYAADRRTDERYVLLMDLDDPTAKPTRLDDTGRATMPLLLTDSVIWKETPAGFNMFSWGTLVVHTLPGGPTRRISMAPQSMVTYPSAGNRFVAAWGSDSTALTIYDLERGASRPVLRYDPRGTDAIVRPHIAGEMIIAVHGALNPDGTRAAPLELWWAWLPKPGEDR